MCREIDSEIVLILTELKQEGQQKIEDYIEKLLEEIHDLNCEVNNLENEIEDLNNEIGNLENNQRECEFCEDNYKGMNHPIAQVVQEIVDDNYCHVIKDYSTREKIIDRLEHALRYECTED